MRPLLLLVTVLALPLLAFGSDDPPARKAFLPGLSTTLLTPFGSSQLYPGFAFHYAFVEGVTRPRSASDFGGYYEWYSEISFSKELRSAWNDDIFFTYATGVNLSFEKFLKGPRNFLVPYFGAKGGGVFFNKSSGGFFLEPILGLVLWEAPDLIVNYDAGLFLAAADLGDHIGVHQSLLVNFNL